MAYQELRTKSAKRIALVAHDNKKQELLEWARFNRDLLAGHDLYATAPPGGPCSGRSDSRSCPCKAPDA